MQVLAASSSRVGFIKMCDRPDPLDNDHLLSEVKAARFSLPTD